MLREKEGERKREIITFFSHPFPLLLSVAVKHFRTSAMDRSIFDLMRSEVTETLSISLSHKNLFDIFGACFQFPVCLLSLSLVFLSFLLSHFIFFSLSLFLSHFISLSFSLSLSNLFLFLFLFQNVVGVM